MTTLFYKYHSKLSLLLIMIVTVLSTSTFAQTRKSFSFEKANQSCESLLGLHNQTDVPQVFAADDEVLTPRGVRRVSDLRRGDSLISLDFKSGFWLTNTIEEISKHEVNSGAQCPRPIQTPSRVLSPLLRNDGRFDFETIEKQMDLRVGSCTIRYTLILISEPRNLIVNKELARDSKSY